MDKRAFGRMGETAAAIRLCELGCTLLHRNVYVGHDEIDLILTDGDCIVFAEVKTRRAYPGHSDRYGSPSSAVDARKAACLKTDTRRKTKRLLLFMLFSAVSAIFS